MKFDEIKKVLIKLMFLNWTVAFIQIFLGLFTGALSILANGFHSLFDGMNNIVGIVGVRIAKKPADESHPYGHRKYETMAAWVILLFMILAVWEFGKGIRERIINPYGPEIEWFMFGLLAVGVVIDYIVAKYEFKKGKELNSEFLKADARHTKGHYITTGAVISGALLIKLGAPPFIDPLIATVVVGFLCKLIYEVWEETSAVLSDRAMIDPKKIESIVKEIREVDSCHGIRSRGEEDYVFLDFHLVFKRDVSLKTADQICISIEGKLKEEIPELKDILIHKETKAGC